MKPPENDMEWISVNDRLPEDYYQRIFVYSLSGNYHVVNYYANNGNVGTLWENDIGFLGEDISFTHWMPLPEPPKE